MQLLALWRCAVLQPRCKEASCASIYVLDRLNLCDGIRLQMCFLYSKELSKKKMLLFVYSVADGGQFS